MSGTMPPMAKRKQNRSGSRHVDRHMVSLPGHIYDRLKIIADRNVRPLRWEMLLALEKYLTDNGLPHPDKPAPG